MARRADHSKDELTEMVIVAARDIIATEGIAKLSARAVASRIGYTPGTLYNHFRDLDEIVTAVNARTLAGVAAAFAEAVKSDDPRQMLHNYADAFIGFIFDNSNLWAALFEFKRADGVPVPAWYRGNIEGLARTIAPWFLKLRPDADPAKAAEAGKLVFASIHSVSALQNSGRLALLLDRDTRSVVHELVEIHIKAFAQG